MKKVLSLCVSLVIATPALAGVEDQYLIGELNCRVINTAPMPNERIRWTGGCKDGFAEGPGRLEWFVGETLSSHFEGNMLRGRPHGTGDYLYSSKARYQGEFENGVKHGRGIATSPSGDKMTAQFVRGEPASDVDLDIEYKNGNHFIGRFKNGNREGQGTMMFKDGGRYVGHFKHGFWDGYGVMTYASGTIHDGNWKAGFSEGEGYIKYADGAKFEGQFKAGKRHGTGIVISPYGDRYDGDWKDDLYDGTGTMTYAVGGSYKGEWKAGKYEGKGELVFAGGRQVAGEFKNGSPLGLDIDKQVSKTKYVLRESDPRGGAATRQPLAHGSSVPLDKSYAEMNDEQKAAVKALYPLMDEGDEPPFPVKGERDIVASLSKAGQALYVYGTLALHVHVNAEGDAESVTVFGSPSEEMTKIASVVLLKEKFKPALCGGKPCAMIFPLALKFVKS
jgi:hypothetical protein